MSIPDMIENAVDDSGLRALGFSEHLRAAHGGMVVYSSIKYAASVKIYVINGEVRADIYTVMPNSMAKLSIDSVSFPHNRMITFINQIERMVFAWKQQEGIA